MKKLIISMVAFATMFITQANAQNNLSYEKLSLSYIQATTDGATTDFTKGLEVEYYRNLKKWYGLSATVETSHFNSIFKEFPKDSSPESINANDVQKTKYFLKDNSSISQSVFAGHFYLNFINNNNHFLYLSNGLGLNLQRVTYEYYTKYDFLMNDNRTITKYAKPTYMVKNTDTVVYLLGVGYDYNFYKNFSIGINLRGQLPLIRDKYFFKTGGGYDELLRVGLKLGKRF